MEGWMKVKTGARFHGNNLEMLHTQTQTSNGHQKQQIIWDYEMMCEIRIVS